MPMLQWLRPRRTWLARRETAKITADPDALRTLAEARVAVRNGDVVYGAAAVRAIVEERSGRPN